MIRRICCLLGLHSDILRPVGTHSHPYWIWVCTHCGRARD